MPGTRPAGRGRRTPSTWADPPEGPVFSSTPLRRARGVGRPVGVGGPGPPPGLTGGLQAPGPHGSAPGSRLRLLPAAWGRVHPGPGLAVTPPNEGSTLVTDTRLARSTSRGHRAPSRVSRPAGPGVWQAGRPNTSDAGGRTPVSGSAEGRCVTGSRGDGERSHQRCREGKGHSQLRTPGLGAQGRPSVTAAPARPQLRGRPVPPRPAVPRRPPFTYKETEVRVHLPPGFSAPKPNALLT